MTEINIRQEAVLALEKIVCQGAYSSLTVNQQLKAFPQETSERERRFFTHLVYTTLQRLPSIDAVISANSKAPLRKIKPFVLSCLRIGICQLLYTEGVPDRAAVHETVELVKKSRYHGLTGYVNGVLRSAQRTGCRYPMPDRVLQPDLFLSLRYDMPEWIVSMWRADYGEDTAEMLLRRMEKPGSACLRANTLKAGIQEIQQELQKQIHIRQSASVPEAFYPEHMGDISKLDLYEQGYITVQDESSMLAALATGVKPGDTVLDLCAAPGGKSTMMAQMMRDQGRIVCRDLHPHRVELIRQGQRRLGIRCMQAEQGDALIPRPEDYEAYDAVLLDAPCSGLGIMRSKPDIKLHRRPEDEGELTDLQRRMLDTAAQAVRPGGTLIYSTCTLCKDENDRQVEWFLSSHPQFRLKDLENRLPRLPECDRLWKKYLTLWPQENGHDGFFVAGFQKGE